MVEENYILLKNVETLKNVVNSLKNKITRAGMLGMHYILCMTRYSDCVTLGV
jgi:hypothetical protein